MKGREEKHGYNMEHGNIKIKEREISKIRLILKSLETQKKCKTKDNKE